MVHVNDIGDAFSKLQKLEFRIQNASKWERDLTYHKVMIAMCLNRRIHKSGLLEESPILCKLACLQYDCVYSLNENGDIPPNVRLKCWLPYVSH